MENKITRENTEKENRTMSAEELTALAKENGIELSADETEACLERLNDPGELSDEELDGVSGGVFGMGAGYVPIPNDAKCKCDNLVCVLCNKSCHPSYYINHTCLHNNLVPNVCHYCKYRMTEGFDAAGKPVSVCRLGNELLTSGID